MQVGPTTAGVGHLEVVGGEAHCDHMLVAADTVGGVAADRTAVADRLEEHN